MKSIILLLACLFCSASLCHAEPSPAPSPSPTGLRDIASSEFDQLTLEFSDSGPSSISFRAFGTRYVLSTNLIYEGSSSHAADIIAQFRAAKYISILTAGGVRGADGMPEFPIHRIQFHY